MLPMFVALIACSGTTAPGPSAPATATATTPAPAADDVARAAQIAGAIDKDPDKADEILKQNGMDRAGFDALLFDIASDPAKSDQYAAARGR
jgi:hypothetical protein